MRHLNGRYAQRFNTRYDRHGHVFQRPYRAVVLSDTEHLMQAARYIALNPVAVGACADPEQSQWSSYAATVGLAARPKWLTDDALLAAFAGDAGRARETYAAFVGDGLRRTRSGDMA